MTTGATGQLGLALPVQGELSGSWGNTVNNGITEYTNIAIAATLTLSGDGAVTLQNTTGDASNSNIVSSLTGAGTVTAQFAVVRITGTLTTTKVVTGPSYSKIYVVDNAATGGTVTFKASGQAGVTIAVGEKTGVYYNGTDYVKVVPFFVNGILPVAAGGTGVSTSTGTGNVVLSTSPTFVTPILGTPTSGNLNNCTADGTFAVGYRKIPPVGAKTSSYTLAIGDVGEYVQLGSGGSIVVPSGVFTHGDAIAAYKNTTGNITVTTSAVSAYLAGTNTLRTSVTLATRGVANILFIDASNCVITGNVS